MNVKRHLPSKNLPVHSAASPIFPPPRSGVLAGSFQIAFTKRKVEAVGGASWTASQFDYLRASLAEAWPGGSAQARCSWFSDFTNFGSHEERWYLYESLTSLQSPYSFQMWPLTSLPCHLLGGLFISALPVVPNLMCCPHWCGDAGGVLRCQSC